MLCCHARRGHPQAIVLLPLFAFCWYMYKWEREDLVPIRCGIGFWILHAA